ncbi:MAG TPA: cell division protein FtsL, partial [Paracoccaceae bacterium]|nr:cell division protein FtsL [Paracoccaceae bacterium]
ADLRDALAVQRAEWAYLNRPERLRDLVTMNFDRLPLLPLEPGQFQPVDRVAMPPPPAMAQVGIDGAVDVMGILPEGEEDPL